MNQHTSNPNLPSHFINTDFCIIFKSVCGSTVSTVTWIYTASSWVHILARATELSLLQNIQTSSSAHPASNSMKTRAFSGSKVTSAHSLTTHICLAPSLKIRGSIPPLNVSLHGTYWINFILPYPLPMSIYLKRSHPFCLMKDHFYTSLTPYIHTI